MVVEERKNDDSDVATSVNYRGVASSATELVLLSLYVISIRASRELEGLQRLLHIFKGEHLELVWTSWHVPISSKGKSLGSHVVSSKNPIQSDMIGWTIGGRCTENQVS